ncbi:hypothetical protein [Prevotella disiens]|uniref:hypothetical protein n=1 Tax=Prevotella disiens TaxID=28130 RepID=UPI00288A0E47|nr:hypothetical protein [Prevotella disiens]
MSIEEELRFCQKRYNEITAEILSLYGERDEQRLRIMNGSYADMEVLRLDYGQREEQLLKDIAELQRKRKVLKGRLSTDLNLMKQKLSDRLTALNVSVESKRDNLYMEQRALVRRMKGECIENDRIGGAK